MAKVAARFLLAIFRQQKTLTRPEEWKGRQSTLTGSKGARDSYAKRESVYTSTMENGDEDVPHMNVVSAAAQSRKVILTMKLHWTLRVLGEKDGKSGSSDYAKLGALLVYRACDVPRALLFCK